MAGSLRILWYSFRKCRVPEQGEGSPAARLIAASRLCVLPMTIYAVTIGALLAWTSGGFNPYLYIALLVGFSGAHLLDNLINDYYDYRRGLDDPSYFRALYGPHPILDNIISTGSLAAFTAAIILYDALLAVYLSLTRTPLIGLLAVAGGIIMLLYAGIPFDAKKLGLGELLVAIVWGPVMAGGTLIALTGRHTLLQGLVYAPFAIAVSLVLIGKHMDKYEYDSVKGVGTLPVRLGLGATRIVASLLALALPIAEVIALYMYEHSPVALLPMASLPLYFYAYRILSREKPREPPKGWDVWPLWYVAAAYMVMDALGRTTIWSLLAYGLSLHGHPQVALIAAGLLALLEILSGIKMLRNESR